MSSCSNLLTSCLLALFLQSCAGAYQSTYSVVENAGLVAELVVTDRFEHQVFVNAVPTTGRRHVYIHGDGSPWYQGRRPARDPTPRNPLLLSMMALDEQPAVYLGRPCYYSAGPDDLCQAKVWTSDRYSTSVIDSMALALGSLLSDQEEVVLIGYSGGAVIAVLLARQLANVVGVITVAGNLDTDLWTDTFGLLPLSGSVNPRLQTPWPEPLRQLHLAGGQDTIVPLAVTQSYLAAQGGELRYFPDFSHGCCWLDVWQDLLQQFEQELSSP